MGGLRKIELSPPQRLWLEAAYAKFRNGQQVSKRFLLLELREKLPTGFDSSEIDPRLMRGGDKITLLGVALIDPESELVSKANIVLKGVRDFLSVNPDSSSINVHDVTHLTGIPNTEVADIFEQLAYLGIFHESGTSYGSAGWLSINITEQGFANYITYETLNQLAENLISAEASSKKPPQGIREPLLESDDANLNRDATLNVERDTKRKFIIGEPLNDEETRRVEFKEVTSQNPVNSIVNVADEYAVAFLNREGGQIYWGVRNTDRAVVGVRLSYKQRDAVRKDVCNKLSQIKPPVPVSEFYCEIHPVLDDTGKAIPDLYVCELTVPRGAADGLYSTGGDEVFIKTDAGKQKLNAQQLIAEVKRRHVTSKQHVSINKQERITGNKARAWIDTLILAQYDLEREQQLLTQRDWTWRHHQPSKLEAICYVENHRVVKKNFAQLLRHYSVLNEEVALHDRLVDTLTALCSDLQRELAESSEMQEVFQTTMSDASLSKIKDHELLRGYTFNNNEELKNKLFGRQSETELINLLTEFVVNNCKELSPNRTTKPFWDRYCKKYFDILHHPSISDVVEQLNCIGDELLQSVARLIDLFEKTADQISTESGEPLVISCSEEW